MPRFCKSKFRRNFARFGLAVCLLTSLGSLYHAASHTHRICAEHPGEVLEAHHAMHVAAPHATVTPLQSADSAERFAQLTAAPAAPGESAHDACDWIVLQENKARANAAFISAGLPLAVTMNFIHPAPRSLNQRRLYALAPKNSPPWLA